MGTIVDEVSEVLDIVAGQIEPAPEFGTSVNTDFILGMGKVARKVIMLLDIDKVHGTAPALATPRLFSIYLRHHLPNQHIILFLVE